MRIPKAMQLAVIGGSQAYSLLASGRLRGKRLSPKKTPFGISQPVFQIEFPKAIHSEKRKHILFLSRHGEKRYSITAPFVNYRANIYALKDLGATHIIAWTGPGAISTQFAPGDFVIVSDIIDETRRRPSTFFENRCIGFIRMAEPFCPSLREVLKRALSDMGVRFFDRGVYVCTEGPRLETPAEIKKFKQCGADLVGMTLAPEAFLARELEICYAAIAYVTNYAEGIRKRKHSAGKLFEGLATAKEMHAIKQAVDKFPEIISSLAQRLERLPLEDHVSPKQCQCRDAMKRYKDARLLPSDWRKWFSS